MVELTNEEMKRKLDWYTKKYGPYVEKRGLGNWRNLFVIPNNYEWTILFMLVMSLFIAWAYQVDTSACREALDNLEGVCFNYCSQGNYAEDSYGVVNDSQLSLFTFKADNLSLDTNISINEG